jgi:large subunit ribosomal protein L17
MKHHSKIRKFGRTKDQRNALIKSLAVSLIRDEKISTTEAKAKELRPYMEKLVTRAKTGTLAARRVLISRLVSPVAVSKLIDIAKRYDKRAGGYLRITKLHIRAGNDARKEAMIEFV